MPIEVPTRYSRLDEFRRHVLCGSERDGRYLCNREVGPVLELFLPPSVHDGRRILVLTPPPEYPLASDVALRAFRFPPGWGMRADGAWDVVDAAAAERHTGQYDEILRWWGRLNVLPPWLRDIVHADRPPPVPELPARAVCQRCRTISVITAERIGVSSPLPVARIVPAG